MKSTYLANALLTERRGTGFSRPATSYFGMMVAGKGARSALNSAAVALNDYIALVPQGGSRLQLYKVTTAGTLASSQPAGYTGAAGEVITDGTAVLTEQTAALKAMTGASMAIAAEPTVGTGNYARMAMAANTTNYAAAAAGAIQNAGTGWAFGQSSAALTSGSAVVWGLVEVDQAAQGGGNVLDWVGLTAPVQVPINTTVQFPAASLTWTEA